MIKRYDKFVIYLQKILIFVGKDREKLDIFCSVYKNTSYQVSQKSIFVTYNYKGGPFHNKMCINACYHRMGETPCGTNSRFWDTRYKKNFSTVSTT